MKRDIYKGRSQHQRRKLQTSTHQNWTCKSIAIPCCPSNVAWVLPRPQRGEGTLMASWLCAATTYGSTAGASARKRWKGVLDHDYWRLPAWWILSFLVKVRQKKRRRWGETSSCVIFEDLGPCFWRFWFVRGGHIQMLTANSCKRNSSRSLRLIYLQKILVSLNPWTSLQSWSFLTFEHSDASPGLIHRGWLGGFYQSALGLWEDTPMVCNLAWSHSIGFFHSFCRDSDVINNSQRGEWDDTVKDPVNSS